MHALVDTCVWYGAFDPHDSYHKEATAKLEILVSHELVLPWPTMYEALCTRFVRKRACLANFERFLKSPRIKYLDDHQYREDAFELSMQKSLREFRPISMVDCMLRLALEDKNNKLDVLATFNESDFIDVCRSRRIEIL